jgi:hypothetical protein
VQEASVATVYMLQANAHILADWSHILPE